MASVLSSGSRRLAILVVYVVPGGMEWLLRLHLDMIAKMSREVEYRIYGVALRVSNEALGILEACRSVELLSFVACPDNSSKEHSYYLDLLVQHACAQGCSHFLTLDVDSFPVKARWIHNLSTHLNERMPFAAVFREENRDVNLRHPSGLLCLSEFYEKYQPSFFPDIEEHEETMTFIKKTAQRPDTGIGFAAKVDALDLDWYFLRRTNKVNDHYLMGGVYGDTFFHLGGMGRFPRFFGDWVSTPYRAQLTITKPLLGESAWAKERWQIESRRISAENLKAQETIYAQLFLDSESYIEFLRHGRLSLRGRLRQWRRARWRRNGLDLARVRAHKSA